MRFADPELFVLLALLPLFAWLLRRDGRRLPPSLRLPSLAALPTTAGRDSRRVRSLPYLPALRLAAAALIILALARPQTADAEATSPAEGIDIVLAIDTSLSMVQESIGNERRIDAAQRVARDFVARRGDDRVGLLIFESDTLLLSPPTLDLNAIDDLIANFVRTGLLPGGTAVGLALARSVDLLQESDAASRVVVLLTDGEDNVRTVRPVDAAGIAEALGVRVYTIGIAQPDAVQGVVDELALRFIADRTGGEYFRASAVADLESAYAQIDALERARLDSERFTVFRERALWFLIPAMALILLELGGRATWWRRAP